MNLSQRRVPAALLIVFATLLTAPCLHAADRIELRDGSVVYGTLKDADDGKISIETSFAGTLEIDQEEVVAMQVQSSLVLQMDDGEVLKAGSLTVAGEQLKLEQQAAESYALAQLTRINPEPWELGQGFNFWGTASVAFNSQRGNSDLDELDYRFETNWESLRDRYRVDASGEVDESRGVKNAENWSIRGRYDRQTSGDWYWGGSVSAEQDLFADLDLRTSLGPYIGRKFFTDPVFQLEADTGLAYTTEQFVSDEDRDYLAGTWDVRIRSNYLGGDSQLYLNHKGIWNLDEVANIVLKTTLGIGVPLLGGLDGAAEIVWNLNTGAAEGAEKLDETYRLRVGYSW